MTALAGAPRTARGARRVSVDAAAVADVAPAAGPGAVR